MAVGVRADPYPLSYRMIYGISCLRTMTPISGLIDTFQIHTRLDLQPPRHQPHSVWEGLLLPGTWKDAATHLVKLSQLNTTSEDDIVTGSPSSPPLLLLRFGRESNFLVPPSQATFCFDFSALASHGRKTSLPLAFTTGQPS